MGTLVDPAVLASKCCVVSDSVYLRASCECHRLTSTFFQALPNGAEVIEISPWGESGWTETQKVTAHLPDGDEVDYFLKSCDNDVAGPMFKGEFHSLGRLHELLPEACPKPVSWGEYQDAPGTFFVIMEFLYLQRLNPERIEADEIAGMIARVHLATIGTSPQGGFGFEVPTASSSP